jgi:hypothetical protein
MAKFCTKCGEALKEGEVCDCTKNENKEPSKASSNGGAFDDFGDIIKGIFKQPTTIVKEYSTDNNLVIGLIFLGVTALFSGVFVYALIDSLLKALASLSTMAGGFGSMLGLGSAGSLGSLSSIANISFGSVFIKIFFYVAVYLVTYAGMMTLMTKVIFKQNTSFKKILIVTGLSSVFMICALVLASIFSYVKLGFGFLLFIVGIIVSFVNLVATAKDSLNIDKDKVLYSIAPSVLVALFVMCYILPKLF